MKLVISLTFKALETSLQPFDVLPITIPRLSTVYSGVRVNYDLWKVSNTIENVQPTQDTDVSYLQSIPRQPGGVISFIGDLFTDHGGYCSAC